MAARNREQSDSGVTSRGFGMTWESLRQSGKHTSLRKRIYIATKSPVESITRLRVPFTHPLMDGFHRLMAYAIAGHHAGLPDGQSRDGSASSLESRLTKKVEPWSAAAITSRPDRVPPPCLAVGFPEREHQVAFFTRMIFSCLVDADFLATESFMSPGAAAQRPAWPEDVLERMQEALARRLAKFPEPKTEVNRQRRRVLEACLRAAEESSGLFTLTVPTGGGKTLSSLAFALRHAIKNGLRRVIYVIPFTSIIEQNATAFARPSPNWSVTWDSVQSLSITRTYAQSTPRTEPPYRRKLECATGGHDQRAILRVALCRAHFALPKTASSRAVGHHSGRGAGAASHTFESLPVGSSTPHEGLRCQHRPLHCDPACAHPSGRIQDRPNERGGDRGRCSRAIYNFAADQNHRPGKKTDPELIALISQFPSSSLS